MGHRKHLQFKKTDYNNMWEVLMKLRTYKIHKLHEHPITYTMKMLKKCEMMTHPEPLPPPPPLSTPICLRVEGMYTDLS